MSAPETIEEAHKRLVDECSYSDPHGMLLIDPWAAAKAVFEWRTKWLRDAEPRLRPVSEKPERDSVIACKYDDGRWHHFSWRGGEVFDARVTGWVLLERAPRPKTLAEEARELLARPMPEEADWVEVFVFLNDAKNLLRRVAEQEKHDE